jgi:hypothetical protein
MSGLVPDLTAFAGKVDLYDYPANHPLEPVICLIR